MPDLTTVRTSDIAAFIKTGMTTDTTPAPIWKRVKKQSELKINYDAQTTEEKFVDENAPREEVDSYKVGFGGEHRAYKGDEIFDYLDGLRQSRAVGSAAETEVLLIYIYDSTTNGGTTSYAAEKNNAIITINGDFGGEGGGGKAYINYSVKFNGDAIRGTATIASGVPSFSPAA